MSSSSGLSICSNVQTAQSEECIEKPLVLILINQNLHVLV